jgi:hypothetical protein
MLAVCVHDDGTGPTIYGALSNDTIVKWIPQFGTWSSIGPTLTKGGPWAPDLNALASFDDGSGPALYIGGSFDAVNGVPASNVARWRGPAEGWSAVGEGLSGSINVLHVHDDGSVTRLIAGGSSQFGSPAQWDGSAWTPVGNLSTIAPGAIIDSITTFDDGSGPALIVSHYNRMARWNGSFWAHLPRQGAAAFLTADGVLYLGSPFSIWAPGGATLAISEVTGGGSFDPGQTAALEVEIVHGGAVTYQWRHNGTPVINADGYTGALTHRLRISSINGSHEGTYDVVVSNDCTTLTSESIEIEVTGTCPGDITIDAIVDSGDLVQIILAWGACPQFGACPADLTHDGAVNADDLTAVILAWGPCS